MDFVGTPVSVRIAHLEKLVKAKETTAEKKTEIERLLPQVDSFAESDFITLVLVHTRSTI